MNHITQSCPEFISRSRHDGICSRKVEKTTCNLTGLSEVLGCPDDCPRLNAKGYSCDKEQCPGVMAVIRDLTQNITQE